MANLQPKTRTSRLSAHKVDKCPQLVKHNSLVFRNPQLPANCSRQCQAHQYDGKATIPRHVVAVRPGNSYSVDRFDRLGFRCQPVEQMNKHVGSTLANGVVQSEF